MKSIMFLVFSIKSVSVFFLHLEGKFQISYVKECIVFSYFVSVHCDCYYWAGLVLVVYTCIISINKGIDQCYI